MRILLELSHPAHVHFFKYAIEELNKRNHIILVVVRNKDIIKDLLDEAKLNNVFFLKKTEKTLEKLVSLFFSTKQVLKLALKFQPDVFIGWNSIYIAFVSKIMRKPFILFEDNENTWNQLILRVPFATKVFTNSSFPHFFGKKHHYYNAYEELAYLHPNWLKLNNNILEKYGIKNEKKLIILRLISWSSTHDYGHYGIKFNTKKDLDFFIKRLKKYGNLLLSKEGSSPVLLTDNRLINISSKDFHDFLSVADIYIGEGATCAAEAAILGTPAIYTSTLIRSYLKEISEQYGLIFFSIDIEDIFQKLEDILNNKNSKTLFHEKRNKLLKDKDDLTDLIITIIEESYRK